LSSLSPQHQAIADLFEAHMAAEMNGDLDTTMATMDPDPHLINVGSGTGGVGYDAVRAFDANDLIGQFFPPMRRSSRSPAPSTTNAWWTSL
jgi:carboxymethylenebutenolidase